MKICGREGSSEDYPSQIAETKQSSETNICEACVEARVDKGEECQSTIVQYREEAQVGAGGDVASLDSGCGRVVGADIDRDPAASPAAGCVGCSHDGRGGRAPRQLGEKSRETQTQQRSQDHHYRQESQENRGKVNLHNVNLNAN